MTTLEVPARAITPGAPKMAAPDEAAQIEAHAKESFIDIPINLDNWKHLPRETSEQLLWFHQWVLDNKINWATAAQALEYDHTVVYRVIKGTYGGSWPNVLKAIAAFRKREETPLTLKLHDFVENGVSKRVWNSLEYAKINKCIAAILGESGVGKSVAAQAWKKRNNHGRTVMIVAPAYGGVASLLREIGLAIGINKYMRGGELYEAILKGFNRERMLVVDEAHLLLPADKRNSNPACLEILRQIHDKTGCALVLIATARFRDELRKGDYMFEQLIGRSRVFRLKLPKQSDLDPIVRQYIARPGADSFELSERIAAVPGRLRILVELLKGGQRIAESEGVRCSYGHLVRSIAVLEDLQGETLFPK